MNIKKWIIKGMIGWSLVVPVIAEEKGANLYEYRPGTKVTTSVSSTLAFGDLNLSVERLLRHRMTYLVSAHYIANNTHKEGSDQNVFVHPKYRFSLGLRAYYSTRFDREIPSDALYGNYIQLGTGLNEVSSNVIPSVEFWLGHSRVISQDLFCDVAVGVGRLLLENEMSELSPLATVSLGMTF
jgi:hypothetical protein|tara:strand:+ start:553 stop:1101 length:549 start_codon:yes stop_codon:yes gene_type:complete